MEDLVNGSNGFRPPCQTWSEKQKAAYLKMCERRRDLFPRYGQNGQGLARQIVERAKKKKITLTESRVASMLSGRTFNDDILRIFNELADEKEKAYA